MADGEIAKIFVTVGAELKDFQKGMNTVSKTLNSVGKNVTSVGKELTRSLTLPLIGLATASIASASDLFEVKQVLSQIKAPLKSMGESIAMLLLPALRFMAQLLAQAAVKLRGFIQWLGQADPAVRGLVVVMVALAVAIGPVLKYGGLLIRFFSILPKVIAVLTGPTAIFIAALAGIGATVAWVIMNFERLKSFVAAVFLSLASFALEMADNILGGFKKAFGWIPGIGPKLAQAKRELFTFYLGVEEKAAKATKDANQKWTTFGDMFTMTMDKVKGAFGGFGDMVGTEVPKKINYLHGIALEFAQDFATQIGQSFSFFKQGSLDIGKAFESAVDAMAQKLITSGLLSLVGDLFGMPGEGKKGNLGIGGGIAAGAALGPIGAIGGGLLGLFGFDSPRNDQMAYRAGQGKWMRDFQANFSAGYVDSAIGSAGSIPTGGGGGGNVSIDLRSTYNFDTSARSRQATKELRNNIKRKGAL